MRNDWQKQMMLHVTLPMAQASGVEGRLRVILDGSRRHGETGKIMRIVLAEAVLLPVFFSYLVAFPVALPPNRAVRLDAQSYQVIGQANVATTALRSLRAHIHVITTNMHPWWRNKTNGTILFQRPNLARVEITGYETFTSDGSRSHFTNSDGKANPYTSPVDWNGGNIVGPGGSAPFGKYFFQPDYHRLGAAYLTDVPSPFSPAHESPIPVVGRFLGVQTWQGAQYQVVEFSRHVTPPDFGTRDVTTVYVGADHLVHRIVNKYYSQEGNSTEDASLTDIQTNQILPPVAFRLPVQGSANP